MSSVDAEKGTTTGRTRRLGYLDLPQIRRAQMVNGTKDNQDMALTKLDWVPRFGNEVKICIAYKINGETNYYAPGSADDLERSMPIYETLPTWQEDISEARHFEDLPVNAQHYVEFIENMTEIHISIIGVGPRRDQVILR
jgi:adenylosuccinate synthase